MPWITALAIGGSALLGANASRSASKTQAKSADAATQIANQQFQQTWQDNARPRQIGTGALNMLASGLGINAGPDTTEGNFNSSAYLAANPDALGYMQTSGNSAYQHWMDDGQRRTGDFWNTPQGQGGQGAAGFGSLLQPFTQADLQNDPGYQFQRDQGIQSIDRSAAGRGNLYSGATMKALSRFNQGLAGTTFNDAFNRDQTQKNRQFNMLSGVAGSGQVATNNVNQAGAQYAQTAGNNMMGAANAQAAGQVGQANALTNGLGTWLNYSQNQNLLKNFNPSGTQPSGMSNSALDSYINGLG